MRRLTPTEQLAKSHSKHIDELNSHIAYHRNECERWSKEVDRLQDLLIGAKDAERELTATIARLEEVANSVGWLNLLASGSLVIGAICVGIAGSIPGLPDSGKMSLAWAGVSLTGFGLVASGLAFAISRRATNKAPDATQHA